MENGQNFKACSRTPALESLSVPSWVPSGYTARTLFGDTEFSLRSSRKVQEEEHGEVGLTFKICLEGRLVQISKMVKSLARR